MAVATSFTAARMLEIEQSSVIGGLVDPQGRLILSTKRGDEIDAGSVQGVGPAGTISIFAGAVAPQGHLLCDGAAVSRETYAVLFSVLGTTYGEGDGSTTFNLPNLKGRVVVGVDPDQSEFSQLNNTGGSKEHVLSEDEMPVHTHVQNSHNHTQNAHTHTQSSHTHTQSSHNHTQNSHTHSQSSHNHTIDTPRWFSSDTLSSGSMYTGSPNAMDRNRGRPVSSETASNNSSTATNISQTASNNSSTATNNSQTATNNATTATNQSTGGGQAHNNLQPYTTMHYIIKT